MGEELIGVSVGVDVPAGGPTGVELNATGAIGRSNPTTNFDREATGDVIVTGEGSTGFSDPFPSAFARVVFSPSPNVSTESLEGLSPAASIDFIIFSGSVTKTPDGPVFEAGLTTPSLGIETSVGFGVSLKKTVQSLGDKIGGFFSPDQSSNASGGFVLYPGRINTNQVSQVYSK